MKKILPAAILWDMDGTIVDTEPHWVNAEKKLLKQYGAQFHESDSTDWVGIGLWDLAQIMQDRGVALTADEIVLTLTQMVDEDFFAAEVNWRPGARRLLADIKDQGVPNGLVTMATRNQALKVIEKLPRGTFTSVTAGDDVEKPKPNPEPYLVGADSLNVSAKNCVAIEDSVTGVISAAAAGAFVIAVPNLVDLSDAPYDVLVESLENLTAKDIVNMFNANRKER